VTETTASNRPLWRVSLSVILVSFALHRGAAAYVAYDGGLGLGMAFGFASQATAAFVTALGVWLGRSWVLGWVVVLGASLLGTALAAGLANGMALSALSAALVFGLATAALFFFLRQELVQGRERSRSARDR
jgi:hypothetical protein